MSGKKSFSIRTRIVTAFLLFAIIQAMIFFALINLTGILESIYNHSYSSFNYLVTNRANMLGETLNNAKSGFIPIVNQINRHVLDYKENSSDGIVIPIDILNIGTEYLVEYLDATKDVSGIFLFLESTEDQKECVYIRDNNYGGSIRGVDSKFYVRGPSEIAKKYNYQLFNLWEPYHNFNKLSEQDSDFYNKPMLAAKSFRAVYNDLFYWSRPFRLSDSDVSVITFSIPLIDDGVPYGVCGFEISVEFLKKMLPYNELQGITPFYTLNDGSLKSKNDTYINSGSVADKLFAGDDLKTFNLNDEYNLIRVESPGKEILPLIAIEKTLNIYNRTSVYNNEKWTLFGFIDEKSISLYPSSLMNSLIISETVIILLSAIYIIFISLKITWPIQKLSVKARSIEIEDVISLPKTNISEIDELTSAVEKMNKEVILSASRLNTIIDMVGIFIGGYEIENNENKVFITNSMSKLLNLGENKNWIEKEKWNELMQKLNLSKNEDVCRFIDKHSGTERFLRLRKIETENKISGIIMDVSDEIKALRKTQYERDYSNLTQILNRRAFIQELKERINNGVYIAGALISVDMDNLKYINDTYGYEMGDLYLKAMAEALKEFERAGGLISHIAGGEFIIFIPCNSTDDEMIAMLKNDINSILAHCKRISIPLPDNKNRKLRFSSGIAWYPTDSADIERLLRYADFAMYETKHNIKGTTGIFDINVYNNKSFLTNKLEMFNNLIDHEGFNYELQPIIESESGDVFAYEMLLRSDAEGLRTPREILSIAKAQSKLYYIELIGMKKMFRILEENTEAFKNKLIFYNIIPNVLLQDEDFREIILKYRHFMPKVVAEISEGEEIDDKIQIRKDEQFRLLGAKFALDDFGSGYNGERMLMKIKPDFVKVDIKLVRNINNDKNKQALLKNLIEYCKERGIKIIAVGVESYGEMQTLKELGVNYYQGFYLAKSSYELTDISNELKSEIKELAKKVRRI